MSKATNPSRTEPAIFAAHNLRSDLAEEYRCGTFANDVHVDLDWIFFAVRANGNRVSHVFASNTRAGKYWETVPNQNVLLTSAPVPVRYEGLVAGVDETWVFEINSPESVLEDAEIEVRAQGFGWELTVGADREHEAFALFIWKGEDDARCFVFRQSDYVEATAFPERRAVSVQDGQVPLLTAALVSAEGV